MSPASPVLERASPSQNAQQGVLIPPESRHAVSTFQAGVTVFKAVVGPGTLFLPSAVKNAGLVTALCVSLGAGVVSTWCMLLVLESADILRRKNRDIKTLGDIGFEVYGPMGQLVVDIAVVVSQLGFCTAYCVFVAENVQAIVFEAVGGMVGSDEKRKCSLSGFLASDMLVYYIILMCIPLLIPVTWLRQLKYFAVTNTLASLLVVVSVLFMLIALVKRYVEVGPEGGELELYNLHGTLVYVGVAMYAFEGVGVLLPVQESMAEPHRMPEVVCWTLSLACLLQVVFASLAYLNYRQHTASIVTISLADGHIMGGMGAVIAVQVAWVVEVLLTFPLQLFPAVRILDTRGATAGRGRGRGLGRRS
ncbi:unnamed protein product [Effrenium voratum]|nr:unnamed protein product [Effrenium voratum]